MALTHSVLLALHIMAGINALVTGTLIVLLKKGGQRHRRLGNLFFLAMLGVGITAFALAIVRSNAFLFMVGVFSMYQVLGGHRAVRKKSLRPSIADWSITVIGAANGVAMLWSAQVVLLVFGLLSVWFVINDVRTYLLVLRNGPVPRMLWLQRHIGYMMGAYIATFTAFLVVNVGTSSAGLLAWLGPTAVGVPLIIRWTRRYTGKASKLAVLLLLITAVQASAQPYVSGGRTRHRFAQLTLGLDAQHYASGGTRHWRESGNGLVAERIPASSEMRLLVGGTHFWGHAHFQLGIPVLRVGGKGFATGVETSVRLFPWRIQQGRISPWVGGSVVPVEYARGEGPSAIRMNTPIGLGALFAWHDHLLQVGMLVDPTGEFNYPTSAGSTVPVHTSPLWFSLGIVRMFDATVSAERSWADGSTKQLTETLAGSGRLNGLTLSVGVSNSFALGSASSEVPLSSRLTGHRMSKVFPEFGVGYYLHGPDLQVDMVYRAVTDRTEGHGDGHTIRRWSATLETFKFFTDMHGFAAFAGVLASYDRFTVVDVRNGSYFDHGAWRGLRAGLIAGWDIRPDRLQAITLRTALRWFPAITVPMRSGGHRITDQLEVDFIQLVVMPGRF